MTAGRRGKKGIVIVATPGEAFDGPGITVGGELWPSRAVGVAERLLETYGAPLSGTSPTKGVLRIDVEKVIMMSEFEVSRAPVDPRPKRGRPGGVSPPIVE